MCMGNISKLSSVKIVPEQHPPHYLLHKYWGRKPHNLLSTYIQFFTKPGDKVLDPFMGSGGVVIESNKLNRIGIGIDLNPMACMIVTETLKPLPDESLLRNEFNKVLKTLPPEVLNLATVLDDNEIYILDNAVWIENEIKRIKYYKNGKRITRDCNEYDLKQVKKSKLLLSKYKKLGLYFPEDPIMQYVKRNGKSTINELFSVRNLLIAALVIKAINEIKNTQIRDSLLFVFTSALPNFSSMIPGDLVTVNGKSGWQISKFWVPKIHTEKNVVQSLKLRFEKYINGKQHIHPLVTNTDFKIYNQSCENMKSIKSKSIDYVFTDPPYGDSISYFALSSFWSTWLKHEVDYEGEIIYDPYRNKKDEDYSARLNRAYAEIYRVLKDDGYLSFTFHNRHVKFWKIIIDACTKAGFDIVNVKWVDQAVASGTQGINRNNTLKGDFVYTFKKLKEPVHNSELINGEEIVLKSVNTLIKKQGFADTASLYEYLIPKLIQKQAFHDSKGKILDIDKIIASKFKYSKVEDGQYGWVL